MNSIIRFKDILTHTRKSVKYGSKITAVTVGDRTVLQASKFIDAGFLV